MSFAFGTQLGWKRYPALGCDILQAIASEQKTSVKPGCGAIKKFYHE